MPRAFELVDLEDKKFRIGVRESVLIIPKITSIYARFHLQGRSVPPRPAKYFQNVGIFVGILDF